MLELRTASDGRIVTPLARKKRCLWMASFCSAAAADFRAEMETLVWIRLEMEKALFFDAESGELLY